MKAQRFANARRFLTAPLTATLGTALAIGAGFGLYANDATAKPPELSTDNNGHYWCEFDNANGGRKDAGPFASEPDCQKVCEKTANGTNCSESTVRYEPGISEAPQAPQEKGPAGKDTPK